MAHRNHTIGLAALFCLWSFAANAATPIPKRYDYPYKGTLYLSWSPSTIVHQVCGSSAARACSLRVSKNECLVVINQIYLSYPAWKDYLFRHEQAHCNGWKGWHPP